MLALFITQEDKPVELTALDFNSTDIAYFSQLFNLPLSNNIHRIIDKIINLDCSGSK